MRTIRSRPIIPPMLPTVTAIWAMSWDGKIATGSGNSEIASREDRAHLHRWRARSDLLLAGARTVDTAPTPFGMSEEARRLRRELGKPDALPPVVIVSGRGSVDPSARVFREHRPREVTVAVGSDAPAERVDALRGISTLLVLEPTRPLPALLERLAADGANEILCEGGGELWAALDAEGLLARAVVTITPRIVGGRTAPTSGGGPGRMLSDATRWKLESRETRGDELFAVYIRANRHE